MKDKFGGLVAGTLTFLALEFGSAGGPLLPTIRTGLCKPVRDYAHCAEAVRVLSEAVDAGLSVLVYTITARAISQHKGSGGEKKKE